MMRTQALVMMLLAGALVACGGDETTEDTGADTGNFEDVADQDTDVETDTAPETDTEVDTGPACDYEAALAEALNPIDAVSDGSATVEEDGGVMVLTMDASAGGRGNEHENPYLYFDFDTGEMMEITDLEALDNTEWDIAVKRSVIRINGGDSGPGGNWVAILDDTSWETAEQPAQGDTEAFAQDTLVTDDCETAVTENGDLLTAFDLWFTFGAGGIAPVEDRIYVIYLGSPNHTLIKFQIISWDSGSYVFHYAEWPVE